MTHPEETLTQRVSRLTGITDAQALERLGRAVSSVLLERLPAADCTWFAGKLPRAWVPPAPHAHAPGQPARGDVEDFYDRVAAREGAPAGVAREHVQSYCRALAELWGEDAVLRLTSRLPDEIAALFDLAGIERAQAADLDARHRRLARSTLAEGRPGSRKPVSEAAPERAHQDSVARNGNPHGDTKLSSTTGTTQEREGETLSRGRPKR